MSFICCTRTILSFLILVVYDGILCEGREQLFLGKVALLTEAALSSNKTLMKLKT
jgi:hypothetical protein